MPDDTTTRSGGYVPRRRLGTFEEEPVVSGGKRLGVQWTPWMGDWFTSWSPRNDNNNAEGAWDHWVNLALAILEHPFTKVVAPQHHREPGGYDPELYDEHRAELPKGLIAEHLGVEVPDA